jgi:hypothetical protein
MPLSSYESGHSAVEGSNILLRWHTYAAYREVLTAGTLAPPPRWDGWTPMLSPTRPSGPVNAGEGDAFALASERHKPRHKAKSATMGVRARGREQKASTAQIGLSECGGAT